jgi:5-methylcytosine-specific restriction endonuclease McrA
MVDCKGETGTSLMGYGRELFKKYDYTCVYCEMKFKDRFEDWMLLTVEHVIPYKKLKKEAEEKERDERNLRVACRICNNMRTRIDVKEFDHLPFEERIAKVLEKKKKAISERRNEFEKFYNECINPKSASN